MATSSPSQYDNSLAQELVTLSAIAYAGGKHPENLKEISEQIDIELALTNNPTQGQWQRAWGPVLGDYGDNVAFIAQQKNTNNYAFVLRGTVGALSSWLEDLPTHQDTFPYIEETETKVSNHFLQGLQGLIKATDPATNTTAEAFLTQAYNSSNNSCIYVTGHSQGAGLTPMALAWLHSLSASWDNNDQLTLAGYGFAPPTSGDPEFADWIGKNTQCYQIINPLDLVPHGYAGINTIIPNNIPNHVPALVHPLIWAAEKEAAHVGQWKQPDTLHILRRIQLPSSISYFSQIEDQHNPNSYLYLMTENAKQQKNPGLLTGVGNKSPLPEHDS